MFFNNPRPILDFESCPGLEPWEITTLPGMHQCPLLCTHTTISSHLVNKWSSCSASLQYCLLRAQLYARNTTGLMSPLFFFFMFFMLPTFQLLWLQLLYRHDRIICIQFLKLLSTVWKKRILLSTFKTNYSSSSLRNVLDYELNFYYHSDNQEYTYTHLDALTS